ncbi:MAG TPA: bifunctional protein-serine/threonine kinase/phosphatase [Polyangiaceae bacterium]|nr:bifunctional protein-serine/threonine kinase/phosphatase [Polyangiaceae bacterium]
MHTPLRISLGQYSDKGRKSANQDFHGALIPKEPLATLKGTCVALADGISSSGVSAEASEAAVTSLLEDYYCTSEAWSVKTSVERVMSAANSWLHSQTLRSPFRYERDHGYVCTFSALVLKSAVAHVFHVGDSRIYQVRAAGLERLTNDHRVRVSAEESYLSRALGASARLELDYSAVPLEQGSLFLLVTDGVFEHVSDEQLFDLVGRHPTDLDLAARQIVEAAYSNGSPDNLTVQIVRVDALPSQDAAEVLLELSDLPLPPLPEPRMRFDGYTIVREVHASHRSHVYLAVDEQTQQRAILKIPAIDLRAESRLLERFLMEEWIARRIDNAHVLRLRPQTRRRNFVYLATEYIEGQTLTQWMIDHPKPSVEAVRQIVEQVARGLNAFHKLEMVHQDLRPDNIMIDSSGTVKIIDFGSVHVAGVAELVAEVAHPEILGTVQYAAPEYFLGEVGSSRSDLFSLGVITYQMLSGRLPYGTEVSKRRTRQAQLRLVYQSVLHRDREVPAWIDDALRKAVHPDPAKRYAELSELVYDLRHPSRAFVSKATPPLLERNPAAFWKGVAAILTLIIILLLRELM